MLRTCVRSERLNLAPKLFAMLKHFGSPERIFTKSLRTPGPLVENKCFRIRNSLQISIFFFLSVLAFPCCCLQQLPPVSFGLGSASLLDYLAVPSPGGYRTVIGTDVLHYSQLKRCRGAERWFRRLFGLGLSRPTSFDPRNPHSRTTAFSLGELTHMRVCRCGCLYE